MSLKDFKKIGSNDKFTTFKHPNGSFLKVAHKGISKDYKKKLDSLPAHPEQMEMGKPSGRVNKTPMLYNIHGPGPDLADKMAQGGEVEADLNRVGPPTTEGVQNYIDFRDSHPEYEKAKPPPEVEQWRKDRKPHLEYYNVPTNVAMMAGGGDPVAEREASLKKLGLTKYKEAIDAAPLPVDQADPASTGVIGPPSPHAVPVTNEQAISVAQGAPAPSLAPASYAVPGGSVPDLAQGYQTQLGGLEKQREAAKMQAQGNIGLAEQEATTYGAGINQLNNINNAFMRHYDDLTKDRAALMQEAQSGAAHLDPQRYIKNMSTGDKILSGIALVLGGIGSGMTKGPNLAAEFLQKNIDRDIENQRLQLGAKQNLLKFNLDMTKDIQEAAAFTKMNSMDMVSMYLKRQAAQAQNPLQQAALLNQAGIIDKQAGELQNQIAFRRAQMQIMMGGQQGSEQKFQQENALLRSMPGEEGAKLAKDRESKHVAGVGQASREVPDNVLKELTARADFDNAIRDLQEFAHRNSGSFNPATIKEGSAKARIVQDKARQANAQGVFKESENEFMNSIINDNPTQLFERYRAGKGYEEARKSNLNQLNSMKRIYGLPVTQEQERLQETPKEVERVTKDGKIAIFDGQTKKFIRYK